MIGEIVTKLDGFVDADEGQLEHAPQPLRLWAMFCHARRARNAAASVTIRMAAMSCKGKVSGFRGRRSGNQADADLVGKEGSDVREGCHVYEGEDWPAPAVGFAADHCQRRGALGAQGEEDHDREGDR